MATSANVEVDLQLVLCALPEVKRKIERLMSSSFIHRHMWDQINFEALMGYLMFPNFALQIYSDLYGVIYISSQSRLGKTIFHLKHSGMKYVTGWEINLRNPKLLNKYNDLGIINEQGSESKNVVAEMAERSSGPVISFQRWKNWDLEQLSGCHGPHSWLEQDKA